MLVGGAYGVNLNFIMMVLLTWSSISFSKVTSFVWSPLRKGLLCETLNEYISKISAMPSGWYTYGVNFKAPLNFCITFIASSESFDIFFLFLIFISQVPLLKLSNKAENKLKIRSRWYELESATSSRR